MQGYLRQPCWALRLGGRADPGRRLLPTTCPGGGSSSSTCPIGAAAAVDARRAGSRSGYEGVAARIDVRRLGAAHRRRRPAARSACSRAASAGRGRSPTSIALFAVVGSCCWSPFVLRSRRRAAEPVLPLWVFRHRVILPAMLANLVVGVLLIGLTSYVPLFAQSVLGHGAVDGRLRAGRADAWAGRCRRRNSGRLYLTIGFRSHDAARRHVRAGRRRSLMLTVDGDMPRCLHLATAVLRDGHRVRLRAWRPAVIAAQSAVGWESARRHDRRRRCSPASVGSADRRRGLRRAGQRRRSPARSADASPDLEHLSPSILEPAIYTAFVVLRVRRRGPGRASAC